METFDHQAKSERRAQYDNPTETFKAPCISSFLDLCREHLPSDMIEELEYHQGNYDSMRIRLAEAKQFAKDLDKATDSATAGLIYNKLRRL